MSNHVLIKGLSILGVRAGETVRRQSPELGQDYAEELPRLAALGVMRPHISHRFPMERAADAFRALIERKVIGKAVIEIAISRSAQDLCWKRDIPRGPATRVRATARGTTSSL